MRKSIKRIMTLVTSTAMAVTLLASGVVLKTIKADDAENLLTNSWVHTHDSWELNDQLLANTYVSSNANGGFTANISITGWQREWYGEEYMPDDVWAYAEGWCDKPFQLTSDTTMSVSPKSTYELTFEIVNEMTREDGSTPTEKNVTVIVKNPNNNDEQFLFTTVRAPRNGNYSFDRKFTIPENYSESTVVIQLAYGSYAYSYSISSSPFLRLMPDDIREKYVFAPGTTENVNAKGVLSFNNISVVQVPYEEPTTNAPKEAGTTEAGTTNTDSKQNGNSQNPVYEKCTCNHEVQTVVAKNASEKVAKPVISATNIKAKKIKVSWKKVTGATKYQIRVVSGKKVVKKTTSKVKYIFKKLKKNKTYKVSVRAYNQFGYGEWSKVKKVKINK